MGNLLDEIYKIHDVDCNQKYDKTLPYSFHLKAVLAQVNKYVTVFYPKNRKWTPEDTRFLYIIRISAVGHDLIEDARMTYNDVKALVACKGSYIDLSEDIAEIIYACTEEKGRDREERHSQKFFDELKSHRLAVFVKLCDIMANSLYSKLVGSTMYDKYQKEFPRLKQELYIQGEYDELWKDLEKLLC